MAHIFSKWIRIITTCVMVLTLAGCSSSGGSLRSAPDAFTTNEPVNDVMVADEHRDAIGGTEESEVDETNDVRDTSNLERQRAGLNLIEDFRADLAHGEKPTQFQKYIMLHDTEGDSSPQVVVDWWESNGNLIAAHFIIGKDGTIVQCVPLDDIAHHAGFGDAGHNALYGVEDESRDDRLGTVSIGSWAPDYGMNSYSIGIELVHVGGSGYYPQAQLDALDQLIAYIDAYYGFESVIIDHKAWRTGNTDTSPEFAEYLMHYQTSRNHSGI